MNLNGKMRLKLIACDVLLREVCHLLTESPHTFDLEFTEKDSHNHSDTLKDEIQAKIDLCQGKSLDAILLGYGICGNSTVGLRARDIPLVIPRAHDCCTLFLGSRQKFKEHFKDNPSQPFSAAGYMERGENLYHDGLYNANTEEDSKYLEYVEKFGEENAKYIMETMYEGAVKPKNLVYIDIPETSHLGYADVCRRNAEDRKIEFTLIKGSLALLRKFVFGQWNSDDFLVVEPGEKLVGVYDWDTIIGKTSE